MYEIRCKGNNIENCEKLHIGITKRALRVRLAEHKSDIRYQKIIINIGHSAKFYNATILDIEKKREYHINIIDS